MQDVSALDVYFFCAYYALTKGDPMQNIRTSSNVPLTDAERDELKQAAARHGIPLATYIRWAALQAARSEVG